MHTHLSHTLHYFPVRTHDNLDIASSVNGVFCSIIPKMLPSALMDYCSDILRSTNNLLSSRVQYVAAEDRYVMVRVEVHEVLP